ncbi:PREDICTED: uncharacterized protein LOC104589900 [Nelumbo nucifera]|uniref:3'-5' exonuclease domain-containing protein n=2 Tax=Nelumbo nucifera TaxID=4432 RepID=A0A822XZ58_NELNU|nr:PREDICTED: uncharacterized protein LOC104589900 [Nelumbo nucifera]DAD24085.1 TPA_asm: hypothetical protein HUJ06_025548 [Nelumbo nucifera]DAD24090.1 TPA_asm: hypothetical protein HUJ06_025553 [Nelumbo nucifera]
MNNDNISIRHHRKASVKPHRAFTVNFFGNKIRTIVTTNFAVVKKWVYKIRYFYRARRDQLVIGLGVQWPVNDPSQSYTLQLCVGRHCLVLHLFYTRYVPRIFHRFLADGRNTFVGIWNYNDEIKLRKSQQKLLVSRLVDVRCVAAARMDMSLQASMETLAEAILGREGVNKHIEIATSDWGRGFLSKEQVLYACLDAFASSEIGKKLEAWDWTD